MPPQGAIRDRLTDVAAFANTCYPPLASPKITGGFVTNVRAILGAISTLFQNSFYFVYKLKDHK